MASGVRRIEATVGQLTLDTINRNQQVLFHIAQMFKTNPGELKKPSGAADERDEGSAP